MIPALSAIVTAYVIFRCIEVMCRAESHFKSDGARIFVMVCGFVTISVCILMMLGIESVATDPSKLMVPGLPR